MIKNIFIEPVNEFVTGENGVRLKHEPQQVKRTPFYINLLRIGDIKQVSRPRKEKPKQEAAK